MWFNDPVLRNGTLGKVIVPDKSQMTRTIRSLESKGLVKREPSADDGHVNLVSLTPEGTTVVNELMQAVAEVVAEILEPISRSEKQTLKGLLARAVS